MPQNSFYLTCRREAEERWVFLRIDDDLSDGEIELLLGALADEYRDYRRFSPPFRARKESGLSPAERLRMRKELEDTEAWIARAPSVASRLNYPYSDPDDVAMYEEMSELYNLRAAGLRYVDLIKAERQSQRIDEQQPAKNDDDQDSTAADGLTVAGLAGEPVSSADHETPAKTYSVADMRDMTGLGNSALNKYAKAACVKTPGVGQRNFRYSAADANTVLSHIIEHSGENTLRERCRTELAKLKDPPE